MKKAKVMSAKRSFFMSVLSLILCFAMLLGTTWAWFTDSVTSGKNQIVAGNLDVELYHSSTGVPEKTDPEKVTGATNLFHVDLWEPGVIAYENFTVANVGNLAFKYDLKLDGWDYNTVTVDEEAHDLREVIKVATVAPGTFTVTGDAATDRAEAQKLFSDKTKDYSFKTYEQTGVLYPVGNIPSGKSDTESFGVILYWEPTDNDNVWNINNGKHVSDGYTINGEEALWLDIGINLVATQKEYEKDSFDENYDLSAQLPVLASFPGISKADLTGDKTVEIEKQGAIEKATVPTKAAATTFTALESQLTEEHQADTFSKDLTLTLNVAETGKEEKGDMEVGITETTIDLDISMAAVMTVTNATTKEIVETKKNDDVKQLDEYSVIQMQIGADYTSVTVKHEGKPMEALASADAAVSTEKALVGGYFYNSTDGILTLKTKTFSPYEVTVKTECTGIQLNKTTDALALNGEDKLLVTLLPMNKQLTDDQVKQYIQWSTSDNDVCWIGETGKLTGRTDGTATITAAFKTNPELTATCAVTVGTPKAYVCKIGETKYEKLEDAFAVAKSGDTVVMIDDYNFQTIQNIPNDITLDLAGFKVLPANDFARLVIDGSSYYSEIKGYSDASATVVDGSFDNEKAAQCKAKFDTEGYVQGECKFTVTDSSSAKTGEIQGIALSGSVTAKFVGLKQNVSGSLVNLSNYNAVARQYTAADFNPPSFVQLGKVYYTVPQGSVTFENCDLTLAGEYSALVFSQDGIKNCAETVTITNSAITLSGANSSVVNVFSVNNGTGNYSQVDLALNSGSITATGTGAAAVVYMSQNTGYLKLNITKESGFTVDNSKLYVNVYGKTLEYNGPQIDS